MVLWCNCSLKNSRDFLLTAYQRLKRNKSVYLSKIYFDLSYENIILRINFTDFLRMIFFNLQQTDTDADWCSLPASGHWIVEQSKFKNATDSYFVFGVPSGKPNYNRKQKQQSHSPTPEYYKFDTMMSSIQSCNEILDSILCTLLYCWVYMQRVIQWTNQRLRIFALKTDTCNCIPSTVLSAVKQKTRNLSSLAP